MISVVFPCGFPPQQGCILPYDILDPVHHNRIPSLFEQINSIGWKKSASLGGNHG
jgi:hypothetical protein